MREELGAGPGPGDRHGFSPALRAGLAVVFVLLAAGFFLLWTALQGLPSQGGLDRTLRELQARGETLDLGALAPPPVPPEENAAVALQAAFRALEQLGETGSGAPTGDSPDFAALYETIWDGDEGGRGPAVRAARAAVHAEDLDALLPRYTDVLASAEAALRCPAADFALDYARAHQLELPHLRPLRDLARLFALRAFARAERGDANGAGEDCARIVALARTLDGEPILVSHLVRLALDGIAVGTTETILLRSTRAPPSFTPLVDALEREAGALDLARVVRGERAAFFGALQEWPDLDRERRSWRPPFAGLWLRRAWQVRYLHVTDRYVEAAQRPFPEAARIEQEIAEEFASGASPLRRLDLIGPAMVLPHMGRALEAHARGVALLRLGAIGCRLAVETGAAGKLPDTLAALPSPLRVDPFTIDADLRLRRTSLALVLYSIGPNGHDDSGISEGGRANAEGDAKDDIAFGIPAPIMRFHSGT